MYCAITCITAVPVVTTALSSIIIILVQCVIVPVCKIKYFFPQFRLFGRPWKASICYIFYVYVCVCVCVCVCVYIYIYSVFLPLCSLLFIKENMCGLK
jgi:hypothetical protein